MHTAWYYFNARFLRVHIHNFNLPFFSLLLQFFFTLVPFYPFINIKLVACSIVICVIIRGVILSK